MNKENSQGERSTTKGKGREEDEEEETEDTSVVLEVFNNPTSS